MVTAKHLLPVLMLGVLSSAAIAAQQVTTLTLQGVTFKVQVKGEGTEKQVVVKASEAGHSFPVVKRDVMGSITGSEVEDLNSDGRPDLFVYVTSPGSGSYGSVLPWSASKGHTLQPITMPELSGKFAQGYMGHDQFAVVETTLVRRFPVYRPGDSNAKPTGGTKQISYRLVSVGSDLQLKPVSETMFQ
ncbi:PliI family lysozyme inhibitor of I-type lysozyme [Synechococcus sp. CB0101]|uniref:PliI family lysozyme inhibitor of I-type lysozyme n=1 Tax=Synechococcus sp. CB0101 TaxID=232348 RepID=UPI00143E08B2|nr:PliI family lysozyme inhibitor of I-type lysozyme [Synechococcus sp. CB0101]